MTNTEMIKQMFKILVLGGNGDKPPLPEQVRNNKTEIGYIKNKLKNMPKNWRSWLTFGLTIGMFILLLLTFLRGTK